MGNKIAVIDPRNKEIAPNTWYTIVNQRPVIADPRTNKSFTTWYVYDNLGRLVKTILPDQTAPANPYVAEEDNPFTMATYYADGNKETERDATGLVTRYTYTPRGWVESVSVGGQLKVKYVYDAKGNQKEIHSYFDASNYTSTSNLYDSLDRLRQVTHPGNVVEKYTYDAVGNRKTVTAGTNNRATVYDYNPLGWLTRVQDPLYNVTEYWYDLNGNQVAQISPNQLKTVNYYDELNRLQSQKDSLGNFSKFSYDDAGNRWRMLDRRGTEWSYEYYKNNALWKLSLTGADSSTYQVTYEYDAAGNRILVTDDGSTNHYGYDEQSRLTDVERGFDGATYTTGYQYTNQRLSGIRYPEAKDWLGYRYNELNQVNEVVGFTTSGGISYDGDGAVNGIKYQNGVTASYTYDSGRRLLDLVATANGKELVKNHYQYWDNSNNIKSINDKTYYYDDNNQLTKAITPGKFLEDKVTTGSIGVFAGDVLGTTGLNFGVNQRAMVSVDTNSTSIGLDFGMVVQGVKKILFVPDQGHQVHRVTQKTFDLFVSSDNLKYTLVGRDRWEYSKDWKGIITITLKERLATRYLKIHVWYDNRDVLFVTKDKATFLNELGKMLQVYQEAAVRTEDYEYDPAGNRKLTKITLVQTSNYTSYYYGNSDRLKTDGKYAFKYDNAGNLIEKGNKYTITGDNVTFTATSGDGVEYWQYRYDLLNRLVEVKKNGTLISEYGYDPEGLRVIKRAHGETVHCVFEGLEPIYEKDVTTGKVKSYVYALGKHLARVDGVIGDPVAKKYWYSMDHVGSVRAVTDETGTKVWDADYLAFGQQYEKNKIDPGFEEDEFSFTGKGYDSDTGLYYFNARWYDSETGRFISEDPIGDPNNPNLHSYCRNNPLTLVDPMGLKSKDIQRKPTPPDLSDESNRKHGRNAGEDQTLANKYFYRNWDRIYNYYTDLKSYGDSNWKSQFLAQYLDMWANVPSDFYKDPTALVSVLNMMWLGIDAGGEMPSYGWGGKGNHDTLAYMNMVRAIQAGVGIANPTGYFGDTTKGLLSLLNSGGQGSRVGQALLNRLIGLNQKIADNFHGDLVGIDLPNINGKNMIALMDQFAARRLYILYQRAQERGINFTLIDLFRTTAQQRIYYRNWKDGKMPWTNVVAYPGTSPHETGMAFDVGAQALIDNSQFDMFKELAEKCGFRWQGPGDKAHFGMPYYIGRDEQVSAAQQNYSNM